MIAERKRLEAQRKGKENWRLWGTVREDYSPSGDAWEHFGHDQAQSRAYRWNEDGPYAKSDQKMSEDKD